MITTKEQILGKKDTNTDTGQTTPGTDVSEKNKTGTTGTETVTEQQTQTKPTNFVDWWDQNVKNPQKSPEQLELEQKRQKRNELFADIGDAFRYMSNLVATTQGAPNANYNGASAKKAVMNSYEKLLAGNEAKKKYYLSGRLNAMKADLDELHRKKTEAYRQERDKVNDQRYDESVKHRNEREGIEDKRYDANLKHRDKREKIEDKRYDDNIKHRNAREARQDAVSDREFNLRQKMYGDKPNNNGTPTVKPEKPVRRYTGRDGKTYDIYADNFTDGNINKLFNELPKEVRNTRDNDMGFKEISTEKKWRIIQNYLTDKNAFNSNYEYSKKVWNLMANNAPGRSVGTTTGTGQPAVAPGDFQW